MFDKSTSSKTRTLAVFLLYPLVALALAEAVAQGVYRAGHGSWLLAGYPGEEITGAFRRHPHLIGVPTPGFSRTEKGVTLSHNARGLRGPEVTKKRPGVTRVAVLGGSTTYGTGVSDEETWPRHLERALGPGFEVVNLGVPGYSSAENAIQTALLLSDLQPDVAVYYLGWNDIRSSHVKNLTPDYASFHAPHLYWSLGLFHLRIGNRSALVHYLRRGVEAAFVREPIALPRVRTAPKRWTAEVDRRVLSLYRRNVASIVALCRAQGIRPVLVPQLLNYEVMTRDRPGRWVPFIRERDIEPVMDAFNAALVATGRSRRADVVAQVLDAPFGPDDFLDHGHFSPAGNARFAELLAEHLRAGPARRP